MMQNIEDIYRYFRILFFVLKLTFNYSKAYLPLTVLLSLLNSLSTVYNIVMSRMIIDELLLGRQTERLIKLIVCLIILNFIFHMICSAVLRWIHAKNRFIKKGFDLEINKKTIEMDYEYMENPQIFDAKEQALKGINEAGGVSAFTDSIRKIITHLSTLTGLAYILKGLSLPIAGVLVLTIIVEFVTERKRQKEEYTFWGKNAKNNKMFSYLEEQVVKDYAAGKYIRLYDSSALIMDRYRQFDANTQKLFRATASSNRKHYFMITFLNHFRKIAIYGILAFKVVQDPLSFTIGAFTMYTAAISSLAEAITGTLASAVKIKYLCKYMKLYKNFIELPPVMPKNEKRIMRQEDYRLEFRNVSFCYPGSQEWALKNVSLKIPVNRKLAIVGMNGAGKTTFIKLLLRLYDPQEGEILLNGKNIAAYSYKEYHDLFSVVFQDSNLFSFTVKENVCLDRGPFIEDNQVVKVLEDAGLGERIKGLKEGIHTPVYRILEDNGIEFSGGEVQKITIARAIFKNAPVIVFDEPTAALDPFAEYEIFTKLNNLADGKTAIFISHRLSSCRACDDIAVFDEGKVVQYGTHGQLIQQKQEKYYQLFMAQAQYYTA